MRPRLVKELRGSVDSVLPPSYLGNGRACSPKTAEIMRGMLTNVVWGEHGTGRFLRNKVVRIAGKTGTCYMIENGQYNTAKKRLAFCGFFPRRSSPIFMCGAHVSPHQKFLRCGHHVGPGDAQHRHEALCPRAAGQQFGLRVGLPSDIGPTFYATTGADPYKKVRSPFAMPNRKTIRGRRQSQARDCPMCAASARVTP